MKRFPCKSLAMTLAAPLFVSTWTATAQTLPQMNLGGYNGIGVSSAPETFNAGFTMYSALLGRHQITGYNSRYGASLHAHKWMVAQDSTAGVYSTIEGGVGAGGGYGNTWNHNGFGMGVVGPNFAGVSNGPTGGWGDGGAYAVAQISPRLLYPPLADMFRGGSGGEFVGYGYYALPLSPAKATTDGVNVPTGDRWWTLFFNTRNFTGPVAAVVPYFFSKFSKTNSQLSGQLLDSRWASPNSPIGSESHTVPGRQYDGPEGSFVRVQPLFTVLNNGANSTITMNNLMVYDQTALWNAAKNWFTNNGPAPVGPFNAQGSFSKTLSGGNVGWALWGSPLSPNQSMPMSWANILTSYADDTRTWGMQFGNNQVGFTQLSNGKLAAKMPEYYQFKDGVWTAISKDDLPPNVAARLAEDNLVSSPPVPPAPGAWIRPNHPSWTAPGPAAGPFQARLDNGMVITYSWYLFKNQPALLNAGLTAAERDAIQLVAEKMHTSWPNGGAYMPPPTRGTLGDVDPALLVTPPAGMEIGYVPIATRQEWGGLVSFDWKEAASGSLSAAARWSSNSAPVDGGHSYYNLNFSPAGSYTVVNDRNSGYGYGGFAVNRLNFGGAVTLSGNPITLATDYVSLPQINQNSGNTVVISAPLNMDVTTVLGGTGNGLVDITGDIFGPWQGLTIRGSGTWRLSGNNQYDGVTSVETGTLSCSQPTSLGSGELKINNGAVLNLNFTGTRTITGLTLGGTMMPAGTYGSTSSPAGFKDSRFSGTGTVTVLPISTGPKGEGSISREVWTGVTGSSVASIPLTSTPNTTNTLTSFELPSNAGDNYGTRIRGYLTPPDSGNYTFWIASDESSELWLSMDTLPLNKVKIAELNGSTGPREWNTFASQKSVAINLIAGKEYYIEALHKEATGQDHLAVGWSKADAAIVPSEVIPGSQLSPYVPRGSGEISREVWSNVPGSNVADIPLSTSPTLRDRQTSFSIPSDSGEDYGTRMRGYITAPLTGNYTFWVASDDASELWLSTDENPGNKVRIARVTGWTPYLTWNFSGDQKSAAIPLIAGRRYYVEALHKEGGIVDHFAAGWSKPGEPTTTPSEIIPGDNLSPFDTLPTPPLVARLSPIDESDTGVESNLMAVFNEPIEKGSGNITIRNLTDNSQIPINVSSSEVTVSGNVLTINPNSNLTNGKYYAIQIDSTALRDLAGNNFAGISNDNTWNFTVVTPGSVILRKPHVILGNATSGISSSNTYTHAFNMNGSNVTINGVTFLAGGSSGTGYTTSNFGNGIGPGNNFEEFPTPGDAVATMLDTFRYGNNPGQSLTITGLTPGQRYDARIYTREWGQGANRSTLITFDEDGAGPLGASTTYNADGARNAVYITYVFTATNEPLVVSFVGTAGNTNATFHLSGFSVQTAGVTATLASPTNNQTYLEGSMVTATANVALGTGPYSVKFFRRSLPSGAFTQVGSDDTSAPYEVVLSGLSSGNYEIYAQVTDSTSATDDSPITAFSIVPPYSAYEGFAYPAGNLTSNNGGSGFVGAWSGFYDPGTGSTVSSTGMTFSNLVTTGGSAVITGASGNNRGNAQRRLAGGANVLSGQTFGSHLYRLETPIGTLNVGGFHIGDLNESDGNATISAWSKMWDSTAISGTVAPGSSPLTQGQTFLILWESNLNNGSQTLAMWVLTPAQFDTFKVGGLTPSELASAPVGTASGQVWARSTTSLSDSTLDPTDYFKFFVFGGFSGTAGFSMTVDELRMSKTSLNEVVPQQVGSSFANWAAANAPGQNPGQDHDNDGVQNGIEYFMGESGDSFTATPTINGSNSISWPMSPGFNGTYEVQVSTNLGGWTNVVPRPVAVGGMVNYTLPSGVSGGRNFVRLLVIPAQ